MWPIIKLWLGKVGTFLKPVIFLFMSKVGVALAAAASAAVIAVAESQLTGDDERRREAFRRIEDDLKTQGIQIGVEVTTSMINLAIESALQGIKR